VDLTKRILRSLAAVLAASLLCASSAWGSYMQDQPLHSSRCGQYAASNLVNFETGAHTTGGQIYEAKRFSWYHTSSGASYHTGKRDLMKVIAHTFSLDVERFEGEDLLRGFDTARQAMPLGAAVIMFADDGKLTGRGHFIMGYHYLSRGDKIVVSDSNRKNPDKAYKISWLLNPAKGHVTQIWVYD
jgi:hypothetical protein